MNKRNLILQAAIASALVVMAAGAQAGNMATTTLTFATENFGPTVASTVAIKPAAVSYSISNAGGVTLAAGQSTTLYLRLSGTNTFPAAPLAADFSGTALTLLGAAPVGVPVIGTGAYANTLAVTITNNSLVSANLPVNSSIIWTPTAGAVSATSSILATAGGVVSVIGSLDGILPINTQVATLPSSQDAISAPANIALSAAAITGAAVSSAAFPVAGSTASKAETAKINLASTKGVGFDFTTDPATNSASSSIVNLGAYTFTDNSVVTPTTVGGVPYNLASVAVGTANTKATVSLPSGQSFPIGATFQLTSDPACVTVVSAVTTPIVAATVSTPVVITATAKTPTSGVPQFVCMTVKGDVAISQINPTVAVTIAKNVATDASDTIASTALYPLVYNGSSVDVMTYVPAATVGYSSFLRIANNSPLPGQPSVALVDQVTGVAGASVALGGILAPGAASTFTAAQVEAVIGAQPAASRPRLRVTAPLNKLGVQSFMSSPDGTVSLLSGNEAGSN